MNLSFVPETCLNLGNSWKFRAGEFKSSKHASFVLNGPPCKHSDASLVPFGYRGCIGSCEHQLYKPAWCRPRATITMLKTDQFDVILFTVIVNAMQAGRAIAGHTARQPLVNAEGMVLAGQQQYQHERREA